MMSDNPIKLQQMKPEIKQKWLDFLSSDDVEQYRGGMIRSGTLNEKGNYVPDPHTKPCLCVLGAFLHAVAPPDYIDRLGYSFELLDIQMHAAGVRQIARIRTENERSISMATYHPHIPLEIVEKHVPGFSKEFEYLVMEATLSSEDPTIKVVSLIDLNDGTEVDFPTMVKIIDEAL